MRKKPPPKDSVEHARFKDLLRRIVAVPKKEADEKIAELKQDRDQGRVAPS